MLRVSPIVPLQGSGLYSSSGFYVARSFAETPFHLIFGALSAIVTYWMWGLQNDMTKFLNYLLITVLVTNCGVSVLLFSGVVGFSFLFSVVLLLLVYGSTNSGMLLPVQFCSGDVCVLVCILETAQTLAAQYPPPLRWS